MTTAKPKTCIYAARHGCGDREAHPYMISGGYACDLHKPNHAVPVPAAGPVVATRATAQPSGVPITWAPDQTGPCALCGGPCCRYGVGGNPLCARCRPADRRTKARDDGFAHDALKNAA